MKEIFVPDDETIEEIQPYGFRLFQKKDGFRFGMDSVLLAEFAQIRETAHVADFGSGSGILPLLLYGRRKGSTFECIEIQQSIAEMSERTISVNHLEQIMHIRCGNAENALEWFEPCSMDAVICNPPYASPGTALESPYSTRAISRNQQSGTLPGFFRSAFMILKGRGRFIMVYPAPGMFQVMSMLKQAHLEPKRFQLVYPFEDKPANLVLIEAVKDAKPGLHPMPPMIIYTKEGDLTNRLKSVYHIDNT